MPSIQCTGSVGVSSSVWSGLPLHLRAATGRYFHFCVVSQSRSQWSSIWVLTLEVEDVKEVRQNLPSRVFVKLGN